MGEEASLHSQCLKEKPNHFSAGFIVSLEPETILLFDAIPAYL
jgi:hypothetical protein